MAKINPYLNFLGNTEEVFNFYKAAFGTEFAMLQRFKDTGQTEGMSLADQEKIMHIALPISDGHVLMGTDALESAGHTVTVGNNISLSVSVDSKEEADKLYKALSAGGVVEMELQDTFWGAYFGMFADKYGVKWMLNYDYPRS